MKDIELIDKILILLFNEGNSVVTSMDLEILKKAGIEIDKDQFVRVISRMKDDEFIEEKGQQGSGTRRLIITPSGCKIIEDDGSYNKKLEIDKEKAIILESRDIEKIGLAKKSIEIASSANKIAFVAVLITLFTLIYTFWNNYKNDSEFKRVDNQINELISQQNKTALIINKQQLSFDSLVLYQNQIDTTSKNFVVPN